MAAQDNLELKAGQKCLVIAPHPDDESIGMGGFLLQHPQDCDVLVLTDGQNNRPGDKEIVALRHQEFVNAMQKVGIKNFWQWDIPDSKVSKNLFKLLKLPFNDYAYVFVPSPYESHRDHRCIYPFLKFWLHFYKPKLVTYEVGIPQLKANVTIDISDVAGQKKEVIEEYTSQVKQTDYTKMLGLNSYRGLRKNFAYAECFRVEDCSLLSKIFSHRQEKNGAVWTILGLKFKSKKKKNYNLKSKKRNPAKME